MSKYFFIILIIGLKVIPSWGQLDPNKLTHFPELDGTMIHDVISDQYGVLWIATQSGLVTFDGNEYTRYHPDQEDSTTMGTILTFRLYEDPKGFIWIGCMDAIYKYNPETKLFQRLPFWDLIEFPEYGQPSVFSISPDNRGRIYFGLVSFNGSDAKKTILYYDETEDKLNSLNYPDSLDLSYIYDLTTDKQGNIWGLSQVGVFKIDINQNLVLVPELNEFNHENQFVNGITCDSLGLLWVTTNFIDLISFDPVTKKSISWSMQHLFQEDEFLNYGQEAVLDQNQNLWISSHKSLIFFDRKTEQFTVFENSESDRLLSDFINALHFDSFNNLWIGGQSVGLLKYNEKTLLNSIVHNVDYTKGLTQGWVTKIFEADNGVVWIGTPAGMNAFEPKSGKLTPYYGLSIDSGLYTVNPIAKINTGDILLESNLGRVLFSTKNQSITPFTLTEISDTITIQNVITDKYNTTWFATDNGLYSKKNNKAKLDHFDLAIMEGSWATSNFITGFVESPKYGLWIQSNYGLFLYNYETNKIKRHAFDQSKGDVLSSQDINALYEDKNGFVWIGTWQGGLCKYNPQNGQVKNYSISEGLPSTSIQSILGDEKNNTLWLSTFAGISKFNIDEEQFNNFSLSDGIQGLLYTDGSFLKSSSGLFFFGGNNGVTYFNPDEISKSAIPPKVYISDFKVADQSVKTKLIYLNRTSTIETIKLNHDKNNVSIEYSGIQYDNPAKNRFSYILENYDLSWRKVGNTRSAFYYNLPPGKYTFRVKAANSNGVWNEEGASLTFIVNPPWWKTTWAYVLYGILAVFAIFAFDRIQRRRLIEKAKQQAKEKELEQAKEIEKAYTKLQATQTQLIHAEKMASLGELTAGIAHEIQNPLNFVNNFSEVNTELIQELKQEITNKDWEEVTDIANDIADNEDKIKHHGKRADAIVKGMLQHSRTATNKKELTDINVLADEYLRLSYHGLRAKDKNFNADFKTILDKSIPKTNVIPQDIGRVLLNLINNAFYACAERSRSTDDKRTKENIDGYKPEVIVRTEKLDDKVKISVKDNGNGISKEIKDKIFQPFFTTKPTGEGTGLGLSMSYDIITKGHGGILKVDSEEGKGSEFIIEIPIESN